MKVNYNSPAILNYRLYNSLTNLKKNNIKGTIFLAMCFLLLFMPFNSHATVYSITSADDLEDLALTGGDTIIWENNTYSDQEINFYASGGTAANPIVLKAESTGGVIFTGSSTINLSGSYLVIDGFY